MASSLEAAVEQLHRSSCCPPFACIAFAVKAGLLMHNQLHRSSCCSGQMQSHPVYQVGYHTPGAYLSVARAFASIVEAEVEAFTFVAEAEADKPWNTVITGSKRTSDSFQSTHCLLVRCSF